MNRHATAPLRSLTGDRTSRRPPGSGRRRRGCPWSRRRPGSPASHAIEIASNGCHVDLRARTPLRLEDVLATARPPRKSASLQPRLQPSQGLNTGRIPDVEYVVAMASNVRLVKRSRPLMGRARVLSKASGQTEHLYGETRYAARKWTHKRRVIIKAEVVRHPGRDPKNNPRFVVTNLADAPETVYAIYCGRGDMENRLKELHHALALDRTSGHRFLANQFRVLLSFAAYILFQTLQAHAQGTACADAQVSTLRERLLKLAAWVERSVRRLGVHLPARGGWLSTWRQIARRLVAAPA